MSTTRSRLTGSRASYRQATYREETLTDEISKTCPPMIWLPIEIARSGVPVGVDYIMPTVIGIVLLVQK